ncbi:MAG TPA: penicillin acylase family protein, partial [Chloroflexi bacterium]|nr:penicillin acylase family protein [Chloroflexota bacterium]
PLLAMDLAAPPTLPSPWYVVGLHGGGYQVVGASLPGLPGVLAGHNDRIAWGLATGPGDDQDLYLEWVDWERERVWTGTAWRPLRRREERITVAGEPAPSLLTVYETAHGPLIQGLLGEEAPPLALRWAARDGGQGMQALLALNRATTWSDFRRALAAWDLWPVTALYADREGRIGWQRAGRLPRRACDGRLPLPGDDPACDWQGFLAPEELPGRLAPDGGIVVALPGPQQRRERLQELLARSPSLSLREAQAVASDLYPPAASWLLPALLRLEPQGWRQERVTAWLQEWEPTMEAEDPGAAFLAVYRLELARAILADDLGEDLFTAYAASTAYHDFLAALIEDPQAAWWEDRTTPARESAEEVQRRAYEAALEWLGRRYGDLHLLWRWDALHGETLRHPLGEVEQPGTSLLNRRAELKGDATTVWASPGRDGESYQAVALAGYRQIVRLTEPPVLWAALLPGQSGHPLHSHYADLVDDWLEGSFFALTPPPPAP